MKHGTPNISVKLTRKNVVKYILAAGKILDEQAVPMVERKLAYWDGKKSSNSRGKI